MIFEKAAGRSFGSLYYFMLDISYIQHKFKMIFTIFKQVKCLQVYRNMYFYVTKEKNILHIAKINWKYYRV